MDDIGKAGAVVADMRKIIRQDPRIIQKLHRRVFIDKLTREQASLRSIPRSDQGFSSPVGACSPILTTCKVRSVGSADMDESGNASQCRSGHHLLIWACSMQVTIYTSFYVEATNRDAFMSVKQDLLLAFIDCVDRNGAKLAKQRLEVSSIG